MHYEPKMAENPAERIIEEPTGLLLSYFLPFTKYPYKGEIVSCPVCGNADYKTIARFDRRIKRLPTQLCGECGLLFTNPMPTNEELNRYYASTYRAEYQFAFIKPRNVHLNKKRREAVRRADRIKDVVNLDSRRRFLDFGCGSGELVRHMAKLGLIAQGFEQGADFGRFAKNKLVETNGAKECEIHVGSWREMAFQPASFDIISCLHVLEHLNDPVGALRQVNTWLSDEGVLYLETPNMQGYHLKGFDCLHFAHVLGFSRDNLLFAAEQAGFKLLHEASPTSLFLVKSTARKGEPATYNLAATVKKNREDYTSGITPAAYLQRHTNRIKKMIRTEIKVGG